MSLDGNWDIADSVSPTEIPAVFTHKAPVPGLAHSSQEMLAIPIRKGEWPERALVNGAGVPHQNRNYGIHLVQKSE